MVDYRKNNNWTVYIHIVPKCLSGHDHDKYYVGITSYDITSRWGKNGCGYKTQYFNRAIQKYGWNNIKHEIIANNLTHDEACAFEKRLINKLQSNNLKYGYNLTSGGEGTCGISNYKDKNPFYGKKHSQETKIKMSKHHYDCSGCNNPSAKRVVNVTDKIVYNTIKEANNAMGFLPVDSHISAVCKGKRRSAGKNSNGQKIIWKYYDDYLKENQLTDEEAHKSLFFNT